MKTTCNFFYTSPTPSVVVRKSGSSVFGFGSIYIVVWSTPFPPPFLQTVTTTLPVVVGGRRIMVRFAVTATAAFTLAVTSQIDALRMAVLVVFAEPTERVGTTTTTTTTTTAVAVVAALVGCGGLDCGGDHRGDHLRHTVFRDRRHTR